MMKKTKKSNAKRKFAAAAAMLLISALVLSSATYAWFTMSKEVEVKNIQITATAPVNVQLSLGHNMYNAMNKQDASLTAIGTNDGVGLVKAPENNDASKDWASTVSFYDFYQVPKLKPASSNNGTNIWTTDDMTGVGRTIVKGSGAGQSVPAGEAEMTLTTATEVKTPSGSSDNYNENNYIDFPVWFRTSSESDIKLAVFAYTMEGVYTSGAKRPGSGTDLALYKAARVSILNNVSDAWSASGVIVPQISSGSDWVNQSNKYYATNLALSASGTIGSNGTEESRTGAYGTVTMLNQGVTPVVTILGASNTSSTVYEGRTTDESAVYGKATCVIVRVWLEGEDKDCWNATEGQDFMINLKFVDVTE